MFKKLISRINIIINVACVLVVAALLSEIYFIFFKQSDPIYSPTYKYDYFSNIQYQPYFGYSDAEYDFSRILQNINSETVVILGSDMAKKNIDLTLLEKNLNKNLKMNIVNIANEGYVSNQEAGLYANKIFKLKPAPRVLIQLSSYNDFENYIVRDMPMMSHKYSNEMLYVFQRGFPASNSFLTKISNWIKKTETYREYNLKYNNGDLINIKTSFNIDNQIIQPTNNSEKIKLAAENFINNCYTTALLAKYRKTKYVVILQPNLLYGGSLDSKSQKGMLLESENSIKLMALHKTNMDIYYGKVLEGLEKLSKQKLLDYIDYREIFIDADASFLSLDKLNKNGSNSLTKKIINDLKKL